MNKKQGFIAEFLVIISILVIVAVIIADITFNISIPEQGEHKGFITAVDTSGIFFKTTQVYFKTNTQSSQEDSYCASNGDVISQLKNAQETNQNVTITYTRSFLTPFWVCGSENEVINAIK